MRLDKYLKVSRIIKRRTVANEACDAGRVLINDKVAKAGTEVKVGDVIRVQFGSNPITVKVMSLAESTRKEDASSMYTLLPQVKEEKASDSDAVSEEQTD
ncbi:MAG: RNA-binding S4 domain-containing protein [Lachnospiraceae bacterium]|nr:RNA-binding S4 domain-containing protein [Lachnospiraceae bacterium]